MRIQLFFWALLSLLFIQCKQKTSDKAIQESQNQIVYAQGFDLQNRGSYQKLTIHRAFIGDQNQSEFYLFPKNQPIPDSLQNKKIIRIPIEKIVVTSTTHIPMLEALEVEQSLIGFPNTDYISSVKTRLLIDTGFVKDVGNEQAMNTEILLQLQPDVLIGFGVNEPPKMYQNLDRMGLTVLMNSDWVEETPLGRAEWIKFFGCLFDKNKEADSIFQNIEKNYLNLKQLAQKTDIKPSVISGSLFQEVWYTPAGESFLAQMLEDANADYIWKDTKGSGSLSLSLESVLEKGQNADFWIAPGNFISQSELSGQNTVYQKFKSFQTGNIYSYAHLKGSTGGLLYFESSPLHPDWILEDLIHILHPELKTSNQTHYFQKIRYF